MRTVIWALAQWGKSATLPESRQSMEHERPSRVQRLRPREADGSRCERSREWGVPARLSPGVVCIRNESDLGRKSTNALSLFDFYSLEESYFPSIQTLRRSLKPHPCPLHFLTHSHSTNNIRHKGEIRSGMIRRSSTSAQINHRQRDFSTQVSPHYPKQCVLS